MTSRFVTLWRLILVTVAFLTASVWMKAEVKRSMTPEACTALRYLASDDFTSLSPLQISPDGAHVAYVLQVPDLKANDNKETLYVSALDGESSPLTSVLSATLIAALQWFPDNKSIAVLVRRDGKTVLGRVDSTTNEEERIWEVQGDIIDYSMDAAGETIAVAVREENHLSSAGRAKPDDNRGYRLDAASTDHSDPPRREAYILRLAADSRWKLDQQVKFNSPLSGKAISTFEDHPSLHINLSPNGRYLLIDDFDSFSNIPPRAAWIGSPIVEYMRKSGLLGPVISYLYDTRTSHATMPLDSPFVRDGMWAPDSKSYIKVAAAPAGSDWEKADFEGKAASNHVWHMFQVEVATGKITEILRRAQHPPVAWRKNGEIVVRNAPDALVMLREDSGRWMQRAAQHIPFPDAAPNSLITSDGDRVVMAYENVRTAPRLVAFDLSSSHSWMVSNFNPEADALLLPLTKTVSWTTTTGFTAKGMLLLPPDYVPDHRYPLVVEDGSLLYSGGFVCDSGPEHVSSFARGILADAGIAYLMRFYPGDDTPERDYYPKGYPGYLAEAAFKQDLVEGAVRMLTERQIVDSKKVGLIGFSRGGWYVEHALIHSNMHFQAATATDNILYSMGDYWYWHNEGMVRTLEGMYGGPPYGNTLKNWLDYSISFKLDQIHTPLLMEVMGHGQKDDDPNRLPDNLAVAHELFVGLNSLNRPVELYYYPNEQHQPDHPQARIASLQRNVDWYRFWLQDYERPNPEDPDQYKRWEHLRELRDADAKTAKDQTQTEHVN